ncbi:hypothetical protein KGF56_003172 [Candida oxycetoniae]|uniref:Major facilitator superfamily (MFS) profile domain-containing protein n=1 Tax=Candida oxycetoniae TaxID=497107 RepID=A0AAI9SVT9_9ASCO|nr:uncharacterized protein KGF56_003172 [Candida oxycetoniae]KAI3404013.2 hypothetical protein KGF56_003172 [Candida oxycetoniae]
MVTLKRHSESSHLLGSHGESPLLQDRGVNDNYQASESNETTNVDDNDTSSQSSETLLRIQVEKNEQLPWFSRPSVFGIIQVVGTLTMSIAMADSTRQIVLYKLAANTIATECQLNGSSCNDGDKDKEEIVQSLLATYNQFLLVGLTAFSLPLTAKYGELSNIYGRKPFFIALVLTSLLSRFLQYYLYSFNILKFKSLLVANYLQAITGGTNIISALANSYVSDITLPSKRTFAFGLASSATFVGQSFGPALGTLLSLGLKSGGNVSISKLQELTYGEWFILRAELLMQLFLLFYVVAIFPESRGKEMKKSSEDQALSNDDILDESVFPKPNSRKGAIAMKEILSFCNIFKPLRLLIFPKDMARTRTKHRYRQIKLAVIGLIAASVFYQGLIYAMNELVMQYGIFKFDWNSGDIAHLLSIISIARAFSLILLLPFLERIVLKNWFKLKNLNLQFDMIEYVLLMIGFVTGLISFIAFYLAQTTRSFFIIVGFFSIGAIIGPTMDSTILKFYPNSKSAQLFSANILMLNIVAIFTSPIVLGVYKAALNYGNAALPYLVYAIAMAIFVIIVYTSKRVLGLDRDTTDEQLTKQERQHF